MIQTTLSVPLEVKPESTARLLSLIDEFREKEDKPHGDEAINFERLISGIPTLHFLSMSVFEDQAYDPIFILEANFDGAPGPFWAHFETIAGPTMREILRCCKQPLDNDRDLHAAVTKADSGAAVSPYLEARTQGPSVFHHGNRGLSRKTILNQAILFRAIREELDAPANQAPEPYRGASPTEFHRRLRDRMGTQFPWLSEAPPPRIPKLQRFGDIWRLFCFLTFTLLAFALPGIFAAALLPSNIYLTGILVLALAAITVAILLRKPLQDTEVKTKFYFWQFVFRFLLKNAIIITVAASALLALPVAIGLVIDAAVNSFNGAGRPSSTCLLCQPVTSVILLGYLGLIFTVPGVVLWLRYFEKRDSSQDAPPIDADVSANMARMEDWVSQNHMGSIVNIRPGILRKVIITAGHRGLGLLLRVKATDGYLGSMRTVHFAHWAFLNNSSRLLFFSNFDQSWGSYLDDFIEKAHAGLTLAWGCGVGFPPTRFLIQDGASHGRRFKNWALASRTVSRLWFSAYPELSVDQIERNYEIAEGLQRDDLSEEDIRQWMRKL